jgi:hypothetical protein
MRQAFINGLTRVVLVMFAVGGYAQDAKKQPPAAQSRITEAVKLAKSALAKRRATTSALTIARYRGIAVARNSVLKDATC